MTDPLIDARGVSFAYDGTQILDEVALSVRAGEFVALVGPNGSGKSTLVRILLGLLASTGEVRLLGQHPGELADRWRVGYVPQRPRLAGDQVASVEEVVASGRLARRGWWRRTTAGDREEILHAVESVGLETLRDRRIGTLSVGQQQRVFIARAFASDPDLLVLDEPIAGVDSESQRRFRDSLMHTIEDHGTGVLLVSHELSAVAEDLDRVVVLNRHVVFDGTPQGLSEHGVELGLHAEDLPFWLEGLR